MHAASGSMPAHEMMMFSENRVLLEHAYGLREQQRRAAAYACPCRNAARSCFFLDGTEVADAMVYGCKTYLYRDRDKVWRGFSKTLPRHVQEWLAPIGRLAAVLQETDQPTKRSRFRFGVRIYFWDVKGNKRREGDMFWEVPLPTRKHALVRYEKPSDEMECGDLGDREDDDNGRAQGKRPRLNVHGDGTDRARAALQRLLIGA